MPRRRKSCHSPRSPRFRAWPPMAAPKCYPSKPVRFVIGFPAGGPNDTLGRIVAQWLSQKLGQPFNAENKGGQSGNIATAEVVRAPADGYTILLVGPANAISGSLYPNLASTSCATSCRWRASPREQLVMVVHPRCRRRRCPSSSPMQGRRRHQDGVDRPGLFAPRHGELFNQMTGSEARGRPLRRRRANFFFFFRQHVDDARGHVEAIVTVRDGD